MLVAATGISNDWSRRISDDFSENTGVLRGF
jgi:hypothetical protein